MECTDQPLQNLDSGTFVDNFFTFTLNKTLLCARHDDGGVILRSKIDKVERCFKALIGQNYCTRLLRPKLKTANVAQYTKMKFIFDNFDP